MVNSLGKKLKDKLGEFMSNSGKNNNSGFSCKKIRKRYLWIFAIVGITLGLSIFAITLVYKTNADLRSEREEEQRILTELVAKVAEDVEITKTTIDWSDQRQRKILFMTDQIIAEYDRIGKTIAHDKAARIAEFNMIESEKYPSIDPLFILALQWKESSFRDSIVSPVGAIGLCQIMPPTANWLCSYIHISYSERSLYDMETNIKLSAAYLDYLYQYYGEYELVLAGYNGGFRQASYYRINSPKLAAETADYVPKVMSKWETYTDSLRTYNASRRFDSESDTTVSG